MRIAVTGGSGQLGEVLLRRLIGERRVKSIVSIDLRPPMVLSSKMQSVKADVRDPEIGRYFENCDAVVHLAFLLSGYYRKDFLEAINIEGSKNVFRQAAAADVSHMIFCSSIAAYGVLPNHPVPIEENNPRRFQPEFGYSATKFKVEEFLDEFEREHPELIISRLRPAILVGMHMPNILGQMLRRRLIPDTGVPLSLVWDEDAADAVVRLLLRPVHGAFNLAADDPLLPQELAARLGLRTIPLPPLALAGSLSQFSRLLELLRLGESFDPAWIRYAGAIMVMSNHRAKEILEWKPKSTTTVQVLEKFIATIPRRADRRLALFFRLVQLSGRFGPKHVEIAGMRLLIHLILTGPGGGEYSIRVENERLLAFRGLIRPADACVTLKDVLFLRLLNGQTSWSQEQLTGRIRCEGQAHAPMVIAGMTSSFRSQVFDTDSRNPIARLLKKWFASERKL